MSAKKPADEEKVKQRVFRTKTLDYQDRAAQCVGLSWNAWVDRILSEAARDVLREIGEEE